MDLLLILTYASICVVIFKGEVDYISEFGDAGAVQENNAMKIHER